MGADVHYSGTVSAAFEGVILGVPAMAVSLEVGEGMSFHLAADFSKSLCAWILDEGLPKDTLLNVNVPLGTPKGVKLTRLGVRRYTEGVVEQRDPRGRKIFWIGGGQPVWQPIPETDFHEVAEGFVSVTPLQLDMTGRSLLEHLREQTLPWLDAAGLAGQ
jgi:5'-nucleotidase